MARSDLVGLGKQSAQGTKNTTPSIYVPVTSADVDVDQTQLTLDETVGDRFPLDSDPGARFYRVPMSGAVRPTSLPRILSGFIGPPVTTTPGGGTTSRTHTFDPVSTAGSALVWHSLLVGRSDPSPKITDLYYDALGDSLTVSCNANEYMLFDANWIATKLDDTQTFPATPTVDTTTKFRFYDIVCKIFPVGASEITMQCASFNLAFSNNIDTDFYVLGAIDPYSIAFTNATLEATFEARDTLSTHYRRALQTTPTPCQLRFTATGATIEGSIHYTVEFVVARATYTAAPAPISGSDVLKGITVTATASKDTATSKFITAAVTNVTTSY